MSDVPENPRPAEDSYDWLNQPAPWHRRSTPLDKPTPSSNTDDQASRSESGAAPAPLSPNQNPLHSSFTGDPELYFGPEITQAPTTNTGASTDAPRRVPIRPADMQTPPGREEDRRPRQRQQAKQARQARRRGGQSTGGVFWKTTRVFTLTVLAALLVATIFSYWTPDDFLSPEFRQVMRVVNTTHQAPLALATPLPTQVTITRVGIIAGHSGPPQDPSFSVDPGAVCDENNDGVPELTELEINTAVARMVVDRLLAKGYEVDLLEEFDPGLENYRAAALVSIHTNDCRNYGFGATGYNATGPSARGPLRGIDEALVQCLIDQYGRVTGLERHFGLTVDMTSYHNFREISVDTPTAIIELAFMFADRRVVTEQRELLAEGVYEGLLCFLEPEKFFATPAPPTPAGQ